MPLKGIVFDMDGILRFGDKPAENANKLIEFVSGLNIPYMIATNECRYTPQKLKQDLIKLNLNIPDNIFIYTSGMAASKFIINKVTIEPNELFAIGIVGEDGLKECLNSVNQFKNCKIFEDPPPESTSKILIVGAVSDISKQTLSKCNRWINAGAKILITCPDVFDPGYSNDLNNSFFSPSSLIHALSFQHKNLQPYNIGKPNPIFANIIKKFFNTDKLNNILFVGDTLDTDVCLANESSMAACFVTSSDYAKKSLNWSIHTPNYICNNLHDVMQLIMRKI